jgi:hypothetical protein
MFSWRMVMESDRMWWEGRRLARFRASACENTMADAVVSYVVALMWWDGACR